MLGKVKRRRPRRPKVSIVQTAGQAKAKFTMPKPKEAKRAVLRSAPDWTKIVEE
jgi:hypothetical protein